MYFTYHMFHYFHHGIVYFHHILIMRCIVYIIYHYRLILLSPNSRLIAHVANVYCL